MPIPSQLASSNVFDYCGLIFMIPLILSFFILSLLDLPVDLLQISVVRSMIFDLFFSGHILLLYVTMLFMMVSYILLLLSFETEDNKRRNNR
jgi:hypothetical protein